MKRPQTLPSTAGYVLAIVVVWAAIGLMLQATYRHAVDQAGAEGRNLARSLAYHVDVSVDSIDYALQHLRRAWQQSPDAFQEAVEREQEFLRDQSISQVAVIGADGRIAFSNLPGRKGLDLSGREHFRIHRQRGTDELYISSPVLGLLNQQWTIQFTRPVLDRGRFAGVLVLSVPPPALEEGYKELELGKGSTILLLRSDGQVLARAHDMDKATRAPWLTGPEAKPDSPRAGQYRARSPIDGVDRFYSYQKLERHPLSITVGQAADSVLAPFHQQLASHLVFGVLATGLLLLFQRSMRSTALDRQKADLQRAQLATIFENSNDAIMGRGMDGRIIFWNAAAERLFGWSAAEAIGQELKELFPPQDVARVAANQAQVRRGGAAHHESVRIRKDGSPVNVSISVSPIKDDSGGIIGSATIVRDIGDRLRAQEAQARLAAIVETSNDAIVSRALDRTVLSWNAGAERLFGYSAEEAIGRNMSELILPREKEAQAAETRTRIEQGYPVLNMETVRHTKDGRLIPVSLSQSPIKDGRGKVVGVSLIFRDITESTKAKEHIEHLAHHDSLTDLPNRVLFYDRLNHAISRARRDQHLLALLYVDLDRFKAVNDRHGHAVGDEVLKEASARFKDVLRESDTVARVGGDEFAVVLPEIGTRESAALVAEKIVAAMSQPFAVTREDRDLIVGASLGIALYPDDATEIDGLMQAADAAMYLAKRGGNTFRFFTSHSNERVGPLASESNR